MLGQFRQALKLGIPMGLQFSITAIGTIIVQSAVNIYGPVHMAGFSAAGKIQKFLPQYLHPLVRLLQPMWDRIVAPVKWIV